LPDGATTRVATVRTAPLEEVEEDFGDPNFAEFTLTLTITSGRFQSP
jgi:hypothetical protein